MNIPRKTSWWIGLGVVGLVALLAVLGLRRSEPVQFFTAKVERGDIRDVVDATGSINAVTTVLVGSQVSGTIARLSADFNSRVHKGDILALIDPRLLDGALLQATADLESARANLVAAEATVEKLRASLVQTKADLGRAETLLKGEAVSGQEVDLAKANFGIAKASVDAAVASVAQARAQVTQKEAAVSVARTNLNYTVIRSPIDGIVVARNVDVGQTVAASLSAPTIFTIAQDLTKMQLYAKADESEVGRIHVGQTVTFKVDAFPKETFTGIVSQMRMNATTVQNVVTYDAIIDFQNPDLKIFPGMTAYVTIPVTAMHDVVKVPNTALRYKPPMSADEIRGLYTKYGIADAPAARPGADGASATTAESSAAERRPHLELAVVWRRRAGGEIVPVQVALGITDHAFTEVRQVTVGTLVPGDDVVTGALGIKSPIPGAPGVRR